MDGVLAARAGRYCVEREAWAWWIDELTWRPHINRPQRPTERRKPSSPLWRHDTLTLSMPNPKLTRSAGALRDANYRHCSNLSKPVP